MARRAGLKVMRLKRLKNKYEKYNIYCDDLEKSIDKDGCYDAKGSTICQTCLEKPAPKKINNINKDIKTGKCSII